MKHGFTATTPATLVALAGIGLVRFFSLIDKATTGTFAIVTS